MSSARRSKKWPGPASPSRPRSMIRKNGSSPAKSARSAIAAFTTPRLFAPASKIKIFLPNGAWFLAPDPEPLRVVFHDAGEIDPGPDVQLVEDVPQVGFHGMRRDEQPVGDPPVGAPGRGQARPRELGAGERLPAQLRAVQRLDPAPDPEFAEPLAGPGRVARGPGVDADPQDPVEGVRRAAGVTIGQPGIAQVLEHGRQGQRPR